MSFGAGPTFVGHGFGAAPCHRHMPLSKQRSLAEDVGLADPEVKGAVIAVDGPAASGKGTVARALASHFNLPHMDTGLLYRAVALNLWRWGGDAGNQFEALRACDDLGFDQADPELRSEPVSKIASMISAYPAVRAALLQRQQDFAGQAGGAVLDGRDIGTVIAPHADVKLFVTASAEVRAERRLKELQERGMSAHYEDVLADIRSRDERDAGREVAPLKQAADAVLLDTSTLTPEQAIAEALRLVDERLARAAP
jgi:cytidylate kinase